jgi:hypothetical protein
MRNKITYLSGPLVVLFSLQGLMASEIRGVIIKADEKNHEVTLEGRGKGLRGVVLRFMTNADTQIRIGKQAAGFADLVLGKRVRIVYEERDGRRVADVIQIVSLPMLLPPPPGPPSGPMPPVSNDPNAISGLLRRVSVTEGEIVVVSSAPGERLEKETVIAVGDHARILRDGKPVPLEDLKENEPVVVRVEKKDGKIIARSIEVGAVSNVPPPSSQPPGNRVEKVRRILQMIDGYLQMIGERPPDRAQ